MKMEKENVLVTILLSAFLILLCSGLMFWSGCAGVQNGPGGDSQLDPSQEKAALMLAGNMAGIALAKYEPNLVPEAVRFCAAYDSLKDPERVRGLVQAGIDELAKQEGMESIAPVIHNSLRLALPLDDAEVALVVAGGRDLPEFDVGILAKMDYVLRGFCQVVGR